MNHRVRVKDAGAVVTGGGSGIGRGIALALAHAGATVVVADVQLAAAQSVVDEIVEGGGHAYAFACDVRERQQLVALADFSWSKLKRVTLLFNNAGVAILGPALDATERDLRWSFEVNVFGMWNGCQVFGSRFAAQGEPAWICNTGSHHSLAGTYKNLAVYIMTKHAVLGMADALRSELGDRIGFSILCPGAVSTNLWDSGRNRPDAHGGAFQGDVRRRDASRTFGLDPIDVGAMVVAGVESGDFYIFTHPQDIELIDARHREQRDTMARQWPTGGSEAHHRTPQL